MNKIRFQFEGKSYEVGMEAYSDELPIKLPDGRLLEVADGWSESMPPKPQGLRLLKYIEAVAA